MLHKLHKLLNYLGIGLMIITASQCLSKCKQSPPYDTVDIDLKWEKEPQHVSLAGLKLEDGIGLTCHVPSEKATYVLNASNGNVWKFTQDGDSGLACKTIPSLQAFNRNSAFVFAAGSIEEQFLFFGTISGNTIDLYRFESERWNKVISAQDLTTFFPNATLKPNKFIAFCTVEVDNQQKGCIMLTLDTNATNKSSLGCLLFTPDTSELKAITIDSEFNNQVNNDTYLTGMVGVGKGKIFLGRGHGVSSRDRYDLLSIEDENISLLSSDIPNPFTVTDVGHFSINNRPTWEIFPLLLEGEHPIIEPIFTILQNNIRSIYRLDGKQNFQQMTFLSDPENKMLHTKTNIILPFSNKLYLLTRVETDDGTNETISYKAKLVPIEKKSY